MVLTQINLNFKMLDSMSFIVSIALDYLK